MPLSYVETIHQFRFVVNVSYHKNWYFSLEVAAVFTITNIRGSSSYIKYSLLDINLFLLSIYLHGTSSNKKMKNVRFYLVSFFIFCLYIRKNSTSLLHYLYRSSVCITLNQKLYFPKLWSWFDTLGNVVLRETKVKAGNHVKATFPMSPCSGWRRKWENFVVEKSSHSCFHARVKKKVKF